MGKRPLTESRIHPLRFASNIRSCRAARCMEHSWRSARRPCRIQDLFSPTPSGLRLISGRKPGTRHAPVFRTYLQPRSVSTVHGESWYGPEEKCPPALWVRSSATAANQVRLEGLSLVVPFAARSSTLKIVGEKILCERLLRTTGLSPLPLHVNYVLRYRIGLRSASPSLRTGAHIRSSHQPRYNHCTNHCDLMHCYPSVICPCVASDDITTSVAPPPTTAKNKALISLSTQPGGSDASKNQWHS